ncbi:MAG: peptidoglycan-binding protein, partial [Bacteroidota bacterium]
VANAASNVAAKVGSVTLSDILRLPAEVVKYGLQHPRVVMAAGMIANRLQNLPEEAKGMDDAAIEKLTPEQCAEIGKKYGLDPLPGNVKTFLREISKYPGTTIGPDTGTPEEVQQLQNVLKTLGYPVEVNGVFDENTAMSVIDFKNKNFLKQSYRMENGQLAINEYVDQKTADVMMKAVNGLIRPADNAQTSTQATQAAQTSQNAQTTQEAQTQPETQQPESSVSEATQPPQATEAQTAKPAETTQTTQATQTTETAKPAEAAEPAKPVVYTVKAGDNLSKIAKEQLGDGERWREIYELNKDVIGANPSLIQIGAQLKMPAKAEAAKSAEAAKPAEATKPAETAKPVETTAKAEKTEAKLTDAEVQNLAKKYGLATDRENVEKFVNELHGYEETAIGPDLGDEDGVKKLQTVLQGLGYKIESSGKFDDATADAVIDFKKKNGLTQTYKLADGQYAINEYVGPTTAEAMVKKLQEA